MFWWAGNFKALGFIPSMLSEEDERPAREQLNSNYQHGGGWQPFKGFIFDGLTITYPGDVPLKPIGGAHLRDEEILVFPHAWVLILRQDGSYEIARMD